MIKEIIYICNHRGRRLPICKVLENLEYRVIFATDYKKAKGYVENSSNMPFLLVEPMLLSTDLGVHLEIRKVVEKVRTEKKMKVVLHTTIPEKELMNYFYYKKETYDEYTSVNDSDDKLKCIIKKLLK